MKLERVLKKDKEFMSWKDELNSSLKLGSRKEKIKQASQLNYYLNKYKSHRRSGVILDQIRKTYHKIIVDYMVGVYEEKNGNRY